jgi:hypothetical protein
VVLVHGGISDLRTWDRQVVGPALPLLLLLTGRTAHAVERLDGPGLDILRARSAARLRAGGAGG